MTYREVYSELYRFIKLKTTQKPAFADKAFEAVRKQIPKKVVILADGYWVTECPNCKRDFDSSHEEFSYCPECGQALDWSVEE